MERKIDSHLLYKPVHRDCEVFLLLGKIHALLLTDPFGFVEFIGCTLRGPRVVRFMRKDHICARTGREDACPQGYRWTERKSMEHKSSLLRAQPRL